MINAFISIIYLTLIFGNNDKNWDKNVIMAQMN